MVAVVDEKLVFGRDQVVTSTQASKNFGEMRRRAKEQPLFVSDRNDGIDTVIVGYEEFESMALELARLREELFYDVAARRVAAADADSHHAPIMLEEVVEKADYQAILSSDIESVSDEEMFE